jgi:hypothetical protein
MIYVHVLIERLEFLLANTVGILAHPSQLTTNTLEGLGRQ